jgi:hypothetical protein
MSLKLRWFEVKYKMKVLGILPSSCLRLKTSQTVKRVQLGWEGGNIKKEKYVRTQDMVD